MSKQTRHNGLVALVVAVGLLVLAACAGPNAEPTATEPTAAPAEPTAAPAVAPTEEPAPAPTEMAPAEAEMEQVPPPSELLLGLRANEWIWVSFAGSTEAYDIDSPQSYRVTFMEDGTFTATADCNAVQGNYIPTDSGEITITPGPSTLAACPEGSRGDEFVAFLGSATRYNVEGETLTIELFADGGTMTFVPVAEAEATGEAPAAADTTALARTLGNLSYTGIQPDQAITLTDGTGTYDDGGSGTPVVTLAQNLIPATDLDGDGTLDAVAILRDESIGSGTFYYVAAVLDALNNPTPTEALMIGDRIQVKSMMADSATILGELIAPAESDPACCGTWLFNKVYALQDGRLAETNSEQVSQISSTSIVGSWSLVDLNGGQEPVLPDAPITLEISDGRAAGSAGCNTYNGSFAGSEEPLNGISIGELATTMKLCEQPVIDQEALYLSRLAASTAWGYDFGRLALVYPLNDTDFGTLLFEPGGAPAAAEQPAAPVTVADLCGEDALALNEIEATLAPDVVATLDALLPTYLAGSPDSQKPPAPGVGLLVITPEGRYFKSVGVADVTTCAPLAADALFEIGSNTKMMTAAIIYQLQEEGVLSTSDPISKWVPEMAAIVPNGDQITIDMLLTHTNGIYDYLNGVNGDGPLAAGITDDSVRAAAYTPEELVKAAVESGQPYFAPGAEGQWNYSNTGYILLGQIIEAATGKSYRENLEERIFKPLDLRSTFLLEGQPEPGLMPEGYFQPPFDYTTTDWNATQAWSAGGVVSNAEDLSVFLKALFSGMLYQEPATLDLMLAPASPGYPNFQTSFYYGHGMFYKLGLLGHGGQALGYQSDVGYSPEKETTVVIWSNSAENNVGQAVTTVGALLNLIKFD